MISDLQHRVGNSFRIVIDRRASGAMRGGVASSGLCDASMTYDPFEFRQARAAIGAGAQRHTDLVDVHRDAARDGLADHIEADARASADDRPRIGQTVGRFARQHCASLRLAECFGLEQRLHRVPLRRRFGLADEQAANEPALGEASGPLATPHVRYLVRNVRIDFCLLSGAIDTPENLSRC
jgi:hypothetical protein